MARLLQLVSCMPHEAHPGSDASRVLKPLPLGGETDPGAIEEMISTNFEFLRPAWPELGSLGGFAENYAHPDPVGAVVKLRTFGEQLVQWIYDKLKLPKPHRPSHYDSLVNQAFEDATPRVVLAMLHALRKEGNRAAHG